jgi:hypothetical protein
MHSSHSCVVTSLRRSERDALKQTETKKKKKDAHLGGLLVLGRENPFPLLGPQLEARLTPL